MSEYYVLKGREVIETDLNGWSEFFRSRNRVIAHTDFPDCRVSTVFLGLDHSFGAGRPQLFETMIFGPTDLRERDCWRYATYDEAWEGHIDAVHSVHPEVPREELEALMKLDRAANSG